MTVEYTDVVVVGTRCAGTATAIALARAGRRVIGLDSASFPSDTLSTHLLWTSGVFELEQLGALDRVLALGAPRLTTALAGGAGHTITAPFTPYSGIDYSMCVRRIGLDAALVDTAALAGADLRERCRVTDLIWEYGRVTGVHYLDHAGQSHEIRALLVVGADGRRSTVARRVGALNPYRSEPSGRACYFAYWEDPHPQSRSIAAQWREGALLGTAFPCDDGMLLCLIQPPAADAPRGLGRTEQLYQEMIAQIPGLAQRLQGCTQRGRVRSAMDIESYFRRSSGPGWALPGDAGHFKDPVTAQGIRDALRYGRLLGERVAPVLDQPRTLDNALREWEIRRERECLEMYQYTNRLARGAVLTPLEIELYRSGAQDRNLAAAVMEGMTRLRYPRHMVSPIGKLAIAGRALVRQGNPMAILEDIVRDLGDTVTERRERFLARYDGLPPLVVSPAESIATQHDGALESPIQQSS